MDCESPTFEPVIPYVRISQALCTYRCSQWSLNVHVFAVFFLLYRVLVFLLIVIFKSFFCLVDVVVSLNIFVLFFRQIVSGAY